MPDHSRAMRSTDLPPRLAAIVEKAGAWVKAHPEAAAQLREFSLPRYSVTATYATTAGRVGRWSGIISAISPSAAGSAVAAKIQADQRRHYAGKLDVHAVETP